MGALLLGLALAGGILKALAPAPLTPEDSLLATGIEKVDHIFETPVQVTQSRWRSIYVHQSLTPEGNTRSLSQDDGLADHFIIGNGQGMGDGQLSRGERWTQQRAAGRVPGVAINSDCLSICLVGDFNRDHPTPAQEATLLELISALQKQLGIKSDHIVLGMEDKQDTVSGLGDRFQVAKFRSRLQQ